MPDKRLDWDDFYLGIAEAYSKRASCPRAQCGAIIVSKEDNRFLSAGYNGSPAREPHCLEDGCLMEDGHCQRAIHAECNAVTHAAKHGVHLENAKIYIYGRRANGQAIEVCRECKKILDAVGIKDIIQRNFKCQECTD